MSHVQYDRPKMRVISYKAWYMRCNNRFKKADCECCNGSGEVDFEDDYGNIYECECRECDGHGTNKVPAFDESNYMSELRAAIRKYVKFTGIIPRLYIKEEGGES